MDSSNYLHARFWIKISKTEDQGNVEDQEFILDINHVYSRLFYNNNTNNHKLIIIIIATATLFNVPHWGNNVIIDSSSTTRI